MGCVSVFKQVIELTPDIVMAAYRLGLFPMAENHASNRIFWLDPEWRGVLPFENFHIPRSLRKIIGKGCYRQTCNLDFRSVISECARIGRRRRETWINNEIIELYTVLREWGSAFSLETWDGDDLVGGLYGVAIGGVFFGESMFTLKDNASKTALVDLMMRLERSGFLLLDTQFLNNHLARFGAVEIPRDQYKAILEKAIIKQCDFYSGVFSSEEIGAYLHSKTQTS